MIHVYTGSGKGKTTAAIGLAIRAQGAGLKVFIGQFIKQGRYSEINTLKKIKNITIEQFGSGCFIKKSPGKKDIALAKKGLERINNVVSSRGFDVVILDEVNIALQLKLLKLEELVNLIKNTPRKIELVLTGRYAHPRIIELADLVSEIKQRKHYYTKGLKSRKGIEV